MAKTCVNHQDAPAATTCHQCRVPVCRSCTTVTPHGSFCSSACSLLHRQLAEGGGGRGRTRGGLALGLFLALLFGVAGLAGIHYAGAKGFAAAKRIDLIGFLLQKVESVAPDERR